MTKISAFFLSFIWFSSLLAEHLPTSSTKLDHWDPALLETCRIHLIETCEMNPKEAFRFDAMPCWRKERARATPCQGLEALVKASGDEILFFDTVARYKHVSLLRAEVLAANTRQRFYMVSNEGLWVKPGLGVVISAYPKNKALDPYEKVELSEEPINLPAAEEYSGRTLLTFLFDLRNGCHACGIPFQAQVRYVFYDNQQPPSIHYMRLLAKTDSKP